jgi:tRNA A-37 threonylcarbamoyl transferase component Bud32
MVSTAFKGGLKSGGKMWLPAGSKPTAKMGVLDADGNPSIQPLGEKAAKPEGKSGIDSSILPALGERVGKGGNGEVYLTDRGTVLKRSLQGSLDKTEIEVAKKMGELGISPSVYYSDSKNMEMENLVAKGGRSLDNLGRSLNRAEFDDLLSKVDKMHREGVYHRDLHSGNIFVMPNNEIRIIDFGMGGMEKGIQTDDFRIVADYRAIQTHAKRGGHPVPKRISSAIEKEKEADGFDIEEFIQLF